VSHAGGVAVPLVPEAATRPVRWSDRLARALPAPGRTPFTFWYLAVLLASSIVQRLVGPRAQRHILQWSSTNVAHLGHDPVRVLVASALWLPGQPWVPAAICFTLVLAPVERRIGSRWTLAVFASGHVLATLVTELPVAWLVRYGELPRHALHVVDVGVSYGFLSTVGVLAVLFAPGWRWVALVAAELYVVGLLVTDPGLANVGHLLALNVGIVLWWRWLSYRGLSGSLRPSLPRWSRALTEPPRVVTSWGLEATTGHHNAER